MGLILSMQVPFVGFQPIRTSEHMASAGMIDYDNYSLTASELDVLLFFTIKIVQRSKGGPL